MSYIPLKNENKKLRDISETIHAHNISEKEADVCVRKRKYVEMQAARTSMTLR